MICYVFKVRKSTFKSKRDDKQKSGFNVGLVCLEGSKFHLETFIDNKDDVFDKTGDKALDKVFAPGFWDIDIDEFEIFTPNGSQYQKKIIKIYSRKTLDEAKVFF